MCSPRHKPFNFFNKRADHHHHHHHHHHHNNKHYHSCHPAHKEKSEFDRYIQAVGQQYLRQEKERKEVVHFVDLARPQDEESLPPLQKQKLAEEAKAREMEAERLYGERQEEIRRKEEKEAKRIADQAETLRKEKDLARHTQEEKEENERVNDYEAHITLLKKAHELKHEDILNCIKQLKPLKEPIANFRDSSYKGTPTIENVNLFTIILQLDCPTQIQIEMIRKLIFLKYDVAKLLTRPLLEKLLSQKGSNYDTFIADIYLERPNSLDKRYEKNVWDRVFKDMQKSQYLCNFLIKDNRPLPELLEFCNLWINAQDKNGGVIEATQFLKMKFPQQAKEFHNLGCNRILAIARLEAKADGVSLKEDPNAIEFFNYGRSGCSIFLSKTGFEKEYKQIIKQGRIAEKNHSDKLKTNVNFRK